MSKFLVVLTSETGVQDTREWVPSATEALHLARARLKLRRLILRIEDELGNPVPFYELIEKAQLEAKNEFPTKGDGGL